MNRRLIGGLIGALALGGEASHADAAAVVRVQFERLAVASAANGTTANAPGQQFGAVTLTVSGQVTPGNAPAAAFGGSNNGVVRLITTSGAAICTWDGTVPSETNGVRTEPGATPLVVVTAGAVVSCLESTVAPSASGGGGGGGGASTIVDGGDVAEGAKGDTQATDSTSSWSVTSLLKGIRTTLVSILTGQSTASTAALQTAGNTNTSAIATSVATIATNSGTQATAANQTTANSSLSTIATQTTNHQVGGLTGVGQTGSITRAAGTSTYAANQLVCNATSVTVCVPIQVTIAGANAATGTMGLVRLHKTGTSLTNANFTIYFFSATPTLTSKFDASAYAGPFAADVTGGTYLGSYTCNAMQATADGTAQAFSDCTPTSPQGWMQYKTLSGQLYVDAVIVATGAYTPISGEVFTIVANSYQDK